MLWGRAAKRCAICKNDLIINSTVHDDESVIGEECHIISAQPNGPRYNSEFPPIEIDSYNNLILLCRIHHKIIDDQHETYTAEILYSMKTNHEKWVAEKFELSNKKLKIPKIRRIKKNIPEYLKRLTTAKDVMNIIDGSYAAYMDHDDPNGEHEVELIGTFLSTIGDFIDVGSDFDPSFRVRLSFEIGELLKELEKSGFFVFGAIEVQILEGGEIEQSSNFPVAHIRVVRQTNEEILTGEKLFYDIVNTYKDQL